MQKTVLNACERSLNRYSVVVGAGLGNFPVIWSHDFTEASHEMRSLLTSAMIPLAMIGSTVLAAGVAVNLTQKATVPVRPAVFQEKAAAEATTQPGVVAKADDAPAAAAPAAVAPPAAFEVHLSADGLLPGKISVINSETGVEAPATDLNIVFMQKGAVKSTAKPGVAGVFQAANLVPGVYSVIASGKSGYLATGVKVLAADPGHAGQGLAIDALAVPISDTAKLLQVVNSYIPLGARTAAPNQVVDGEAAAANAGGPSDPRAVPLLDGNRVTGRIMRLHPETGAVLKFHAGSMHVFLLQGDAIVSQAALDETGAFTLEGAREGAFSLAAAGAEGFAAFGIRIATPDGKLTQNAASPNVFQVSFAANMRAAGASGSAAIDMANFPAAYQRLTNSQPQSSNSTPPGSNTGGTGGGGGGTGGGGAGGGGGLGALGAALGAAGLAAALANDNNDNPTSP